MIQWNDRKSNNITEWSRELQKFHLRKFLPRSMSSSQPHYVIPHKNMHHYWKIVGFRGFRDDKITNKTHGPEHFWENWKITPIVFRHICLNINWFGGVIFHFYFNAYICDLQLSFEKSFPQPLCWRNHEQLTHKTLRIYYSSTLL